MRLRIWGLGPFVVFLLLVAAPRARAQLRPDADAGFWQRVRARVELGYSGRSNDASGFHVLSPVISADYAYSHGWGMGVDWGFALGVESPAHAADGWIAAQGDPMLKVWYQSREASDRFHVYAGASVPTAWLPRDVVRRGLTRNAYAFAAATRGLWNAWLWAPEQVTFALGGKYLHELVPNMRLVVEAGGAAGLALSKLTDRAGTAYAQLAPALELYDAPVTLGLRVQGVLTSTGGDPLQFGASAYMRVTVTSLQLEAAGLCNLDAPLGFTRSGASLCGVWLAAEVRP